MNKTTAIATIIAETDQEPIVFTTGYACRIACGHGDRPNHFYMTGSMGLASSIATGVSMQTRRTTVVVDGDGSLLMNPVGLIVAGALPDLPLVHIVLDDGRYASTGGQVVPSHEVDICAWAVAAGYPRVLQCASAEVFTDVLRTELLSICGPVFVRVVLTEPDLPVPARIAADLSEHATRFQQHVMAVSASC